MDVKEDYQDAWVANNRRGKILTRFALFGAKQHHSNKAWKRQRHRKDRRYGNRLRSEMVQERRLIA